MAISSLQPVIDPNKSYTFSDYFKLNPRIGEFTKYFGYRHENQDYRLPQIDIDEGYFAPLQRELNEILLYVDLTSEIARREVLIAPVLLNIARYLKIKIYIEYYLDVSNQLRGTVDYYLENSGNFLVVEAKNESLERGFVQLAAELIALDQLQENTNSMLYGAVSVGRVWQFGILEPKTKTIIQDINLFQVPAELSQLLKVLAAILE
ncbi:MAG: hypothetical protein AAF702_21990 [Chloroflexota bacterium]